MLKLDGLCLFDTLGVHNAIMFQNKIVECPSAIHSVVLVVLQFFCHGESFEVEEEQRVGLRREYCLVQLQQVTFEFVDGLRTSKRRCLVCTITHIDHCTHHR